MSSSRARSSPDPIGRPGALRGRASDALAVAGPDALRAALAGVRAVLLDLDGVLSLKGRAIPGAAEALSTLDRLDVPYRVATNTSLVSRSTLARSLAERGIPVPPDRLLTALSAAAAWTAQRHPGEPLYVLASDDARTEFAGQRLLDHEAAARPGASAAAVVIGDSPEELSWANLDRAFRLVRGGAELVAMHRNPWWLTPDGPTIDSGAFVAALEYATGVRAVVVGKPARPFFRAAVRTLGEVVGRRRLASRDVVMVGDDATTDIAGAHRAGLRAIFVLTGKQTLEDVAGAARRSRLARPDAVAASVADVVRALVAGTGAARRPGGE
ncbi:MAG TPA: HAD-IIA family hydrolase [Candidatus Limnocylindrales bacterium]|nr:HAD-IIA family hydrolase [Candidatus Limnocylindrales bacterium]